MKGMRAEIIAALILAAVTFFGYMVIVGSYPFAEEEKLHPYYNVLMLIKAFFLGINLLADAIMFGMAMQRQYREEMSQE